jgi:hypothetical protein
MCREIPLDVLGLRCVVRVIDRRCVADVDAVFGREGILGSRIVHCSVGCGVNKRERRTSRHDRVDRVSRVEGGQQAARRLGWVGCREVFGGRKKGGCK